MSGYDLAVVGAGIVGLASALAAVRRGLKVVVIERDAACVGASIRNFGFITVTGQRAGAHWRRALRTREVWAEVAPRAGIEIVQSGLALLARRPEAVAVAEAFLRTEMGAGCRLLSSSEAADLVPALRRAAGDAVLYSPHELRVESRTAIPQLARWLAQQHGVDFRWSTAVHAVEPPVIATSRGPIEAQACIVCPGHDRTTLFADAIAPAQIRICTLQMLRVAPALPIWLGAAVMSDLSLARYEGFAALPEAATLAARLEQELPATLGAGIHLIAVQSADGSLVVGDSHLYDDVPAAFAAAGVEALILDELDRILELPGRAVIERWTGSYAAAEDVVFAAAPAAGVRLAIVTGGTGASTGFAFAEEVVADLFT